MIFVTIGTQEPFNRLVKAMDEIALKLDDEIVVQAFGLNFEPINLTVKEFLSTEDFNTLLKSAKIVISHAGMGTIISALQFKKTIIVMPRLTRLREHRNDHQLSTAKKMENLKYVNVAYDVENLKKLIFEHFNHSGLAVSRKLSDNASDTLIDSIKEYMHSVDLASVKKR